MKKVVLIGNGGHGKVVKEIVQARSDMELAGVLDDGFSGFAVRNGLYTGRTKDVPMLRKLVPRPYSRYASAATASESSLLKRLGLKMTIMPHSFTPGRSSVKRLPSDTERL